MKIFERHKLVILDKPYQMTELLKKLRIDKDQPLWIIDLPADCEELFQEVVVKEKLQGKTPLRQLILFASDSKSLAHYMPLIGSHISQETLFWIAYPKKTGVIASDLIQMKAWDIVFQSGYRGQTSVSINDDWSGMRFTNAPKNKPSICDVPMAERKMEGIDFVNRTVQLPADALAAVKKHAGMEAFFNAMSFTHKKEYVQAIIEAKKEETRIRRIEKTVEMLKQKMTARVKSAPAKQ